MSGTMSINVIGQSWRVGRACPQRAGLRLTVCGGALRTGAPYLPLSLRPCASLLDPPCGTAAGGLPCMVKATTRAAFYVNAPHHRLRLEDRFLTRRDFLGRSGLGFGMLGLAAVLGPEILAAAPA